MALPCLALRVISPAEARRVLERAGFCERASVGERRRFELLLRST
jgi:hypothetical protein